MKRIAVLLSGAERLHARLDDTLRNKIVSVYYIAQGRKVTAEGKLKRGMGHKVEQTYSIGIVV